MPGWEDNIYYHPEKSGLVIIDALERDNLSYEFDMLVAFKETATGKVFLGDDSGCSCPSPFEDVDFQDLSLVTDREELRRLVDQKTAWGSWSDKQKFLDKVEAAL